ncbi:flavin reductase family protein [Alicyclobacillus kakegawensis]|uniref:flavin reductase family protein n=1 Tax=Alicyclobacillus kakegawensis TaxID=392012 RepID=UPI000830319A|nr:flavin reductase family protein [Alicyclobacillus kakegawensis]
MEYSPTESKRFRETLGMFATGVTVLSTWLDGRAHAMTANAFTSVSLEPPLILVCLSRGCRMSALLQPGVQFGVNVLAAGQEPLSRYFAGGLREQPEFRFRDWAGVPRLEETLCTLACEVENVMEGGDHGIVLARVQRLYVEPRPLRPLLFWKGGYLPVTAVGV